MWHDSSSISSEQLVVLSSLVNLLPSEISISAFLTMKYCCTINSSSRLALLTILLSIASCSSASPTPQRTAKPTSTTPKPTTGLTVSKATILAADNAVANKKDADEDFKLQLSNHMNWEHLLSPAPLSIGLLGDLMIMSSQTRDFAIDSELPRNGFIQYVKYPKSFRATLVQIGNEGQRAFMVAHTNMDKIRLLTGDVPMYMKEATRILVTGDEELVADYLPAPMERIRQAAEQSVLLSKGVVWQFENVMNLTSEVLEMCTSEKSIQETNLQKAIDRQKILNITIPSFQQMVDQLNQSVIRDTETMGRAEEDMRKALKDMPSGWEMIGMDFVQKISDVVTSTLSVLPTLAAAPGKLINNVIDLSTEKISGSSGWDATSDVAESANGSAAYFTGTNLIDPCIVQNKKHVLSVYSLIKNLGQSYPTLQSIDSGKKGRYEPVDDTTHFNKISNDVDMCDPIVEVIEKGLEFVQALGKLAKMSKMENVTEEEFQLNRQSEFENVLSVIKEVRQTSTELKNSVMANQQAVPNNTPLLSRARKQANVHGSASQQALANCRYRAEMAQATLQNTRQSMEKTRLLMIEQNNEFLKLLTEQQSLKLDEVRYDEIIKALQEGLKKLSLLKEHWTKLVMFFQKISNIVEHVAVKSIEDFANHIETTSSKLKNIHKEFVIDTLYAKALKATQATALVNDMAEIYVNVSDRYIMPSVSSLSQLIVTDPDEAAAKRSRLLSQCSEDSRAIVDLIVMEKTKTIRQVTMRSEQIKKEYAFLEDVKTRQIQVLRAKTEQEVKKKGGRMTTAERNAKVDELMEEKIEQDPFLKENDILDYGEDNVEAVESGDF